MKAAAAAAAVRGRYRACAGGLIFDRAGRVLAAERLDRPGQWQFPQGGVDPGESAAAAAEREVYEELGLRAPGIRRVAALPEGIRYDVPPGTWLERQGFAGQEMFWSLFYCPLEGDPGQHCNLEGLGGEKPEFSRVGWWTWGDLLRNVVEFKRPVYHRLRELSLPEIEAFLARGGPEEEEGP